jgi:hypothetical protein
MRIKMEDGIDAAKLLHKIRNTITTQLRACGVVLHDDVGYRIRPGSNEEARIIDTIARNCVQIVVTQPECQTAEVRSGS